MLGKKLAALLARPQEAPARILNKLRTLADYSTTPCQLTNSGGPEALKFEVSKLFPCSRSDVADPTQFESILYTRASDTVEPFDRSHNGTQTLGRLCYYACRLLRPRIVVETGVAYGVTSAYILQALAENGHGRLHSIDLPPLSPRADEHVGLLVLPELRHRWSLTMGSANKVLPSLLSELGEIDLFVHDSLHTYSHMTWEFATVLPSLRAGGGIISDDISGNRAFEELTARPEVDRWFAIHQEGKNGLCGAATIRVPR